MTRHGSQDAAAEVHRQSVGTDIRKLVTTSVALNLRSNGAASDGARSGYRKMARRAFPHALKVRVSPRLLMIHSEMQKAQYGSGGAAAGAFEGADVAFFLHILGWEMHNKEQGLTERSLGLNSNLSSQGALIKWGPQ